MEVHLRKLDQGHLVVRGGVGTQDTLLSSLMSASFLRRP